MPRFTHPILWYLTNTDEESPGPIRITMRAVIPIEIEDQDGNWRDANAVVDTGSSFSFLGVNYARTLNLLIPLPTGTLQLVTATGLVHVPVTDGEIHLRFPQFRERTFRLKCIFRDQPDAVPPLLGLHNVLDLMTIRFDGTPLPQLGSFHPENGLMGSMEFIFPDE